VTTSGGATHAIWQGVEKLVLSKMLVKGSNRRIHSVDKHAGVVRNPFPSTPPPQGLADSVHRHHQPLTHSTVYSPRHRVFVASAVRVLIHGRSGSVDS